MMKSKDFNVQPIHSTSTARSRNHARLASLAIGVSALLAGCSGNVEVGSGSEECDYCESPSSAPPAYEASGECATEDQYTWDNYLSYRNGDPNDFGALAGTRWLGTSNSGIKLELQLGDDGTGRLIVGDEPAPVIADKGYLCIDTSTGTVETDCAQFPATGATYPIGGVTFVDSQLTGIFNEGLAMDDWCALQTPTLFDEGQSCGFGPFENVSFTQSGPDDCTTNETDPIDCNWMYRILYEMRCDCISDKCFAANQASSSDLDFTYDPSNKTLTAAGTGLDGVTLTRAD